MDKIVPTKPLLVMLYGFPGAGKTFFARQLSEHMQLAHVQGDRIRHELFEQPRYDKQENTVVMQLTNYMTEQFLNAGVSVIYDTNAMRVGQRRALRDMARKAGGESLLVWLQIDVESAFMRVAQRDRRKTDDKYAMPLDRTTFDNLTKHMQNPLREENYVVISGKHSHKTQQLSVIKKLRVKGIVNPEEPTAKLVMPGLVNHVPNPTAGRVDLDRRNIVIR
ncbi:MAG TPA: ATP-binding protein [Candidatus Saccharimonadales bacterium]|nr:ATP-binding protein [Candidatus Saccharimonadales bacterium]